MAAPLSNHDFPGRYVLSPEGARAARRLTVGEEIGLFVYYEWNAVAVRTRDLSTWVPHARHGGATCALELVDNDGDYRWMLVADRALAAGDLLTLDYRRAAWFICAPPSPLVGVPLAPPRWRVASSPVHGRGVFATARLEADTTLEAVIRFDYRVVPVFTREFGRYVNHSWAPNSRLVWDVTRRSWMLVTTRRVGKGTEVTLDYRETPWYAAKPDPRWM